MAKKTINGIDSISCYPDGKKFRCELTKKDGKKVNVKEVIALFTETESRVQITPIKKTAFIYSDMLNNTCKVIKSSNGNEISCSYGGKY